MNETIQFLKRLTGIRLSANERLAMRERLAAYTDMHPALAAGAVPSPFSSFFGAISSRRFSAYALAALLIAVSGSSLTLAAEGSAPGDSLYSIKIHVTEPVMTTFAATPKAQAEVAANIASRRVDEAVTLASRGTLTAERQQYLTREFSSRVAIATKKADALGDKGDAAAAETAKADLAVQLAGEAQALGAVTRKDSSESSDLLTAVVASSQQISGEETGDDAPVIAATLAADAASTSGFAASTSVRSAKMAAPAAFKAARLHQSVRITASTTLRALAPALEASGLLMPKTDHAIPTYTTSGNATLNVSIPSDH